MTNYITAEIWYAAFEPKAIHVATFKLKAKKGTTNEAWLEVLFEYTQSIDEPWIDARYDDMVWIMDCKGLRSMSVGDYVRFEDGSIFQVVPVGFTQVDNMEPVPVRAGSSLIDRNAV